MRSHHSDRFTIISGAQTGVDRAALDAALEVGVQCGGSCPKGRKAEDGVIPQHYPVTELESGGYRERTLMNIAQSDGTLIIYFGCPGGGTELTLLGCIKKKKPYLLIDAEEVSSMRTVARIRRFVSDGNIVRLNVAGPRASGDPRAYDYAYAVVRDYLTLVSDVACRQ